MMSEIKKYCTYCKKEISNRNSRTAYFTNTAQNKELFFCNNGCKKSWLEQERKEKLEKKFFCQYCESEWDSKRGKAHHERHCSKNPNKPKIKSYSIEEIKEIDKTFGLTDTQIAKFIRNYKIREVDEIDE